MRRLGKAEVKSLLARVRGWKVVKGKLHREFKFEDFNQAIRFIDRLRPLANRMNHHPELYNVYDKVTIDIVTHDAGGITELDFEFAEKVNRLMGNFL